jgi:hypothetical protein
MEQKIGYVLLDTDNQVLKTWIQDHVPSMFILPNGDHVHAPSIGTYAGCKFVEKWLVTDPSPDLIEETQTQVFDGTRYVATAVYRYPYHNELLAHSASARYIKETSGITVSNNLIYTDRQSQAMITGLVAVMNADPTTVVSFKTGNGFIQANSTVVQLISDSVAKHVQSCFTMESNIADMVQSNTITLYTEIDSEYDSMNVAYPV